MISRAIRGQKEMGVVVKLGLLSLLAAHMKVGLYWNTSRSLHPSPSTGIAQEVPWIRETSCAAPYWVGLNVIVRNFPPSLRFVFVYVEPQSAGM